MSEWISVKDGLPENDDRLEKEEGFPCESYYVIAYGKPKGSKKKVVEATSRYLIHQTDFPSYFGELGNLQFETWCWPDYWEKVTHWMPFPKPPKETDNE